MASVPTERLVSVHSQTRVQGRAPIWQTLDRGPWPHIQLCLLSPSFSLCWPSSRPAVGSSGRCTFPLVGCISKSDTWFLWSPSSQTYIQVNSLFGGDWDLGSLQPRPSFIPLLRSPCLGGSRVEVGSLPLWKVLKSGQTLEFWGLWHKQLQVPVGKQSCLVLLPWGCCRHGIGESQSQSLSPTALNARAKLNIWRIFHYSPQPQIEISPFSQFPSYTSSPHCFRFGGLDRSQVYDVV